MNLSQDPPHEYGKESTPSQNQPESHDPATALANLTFNYFYSPEHSQFQSPTKSEGTLGATNHYAYTVWSVIIFVQAAAECLPVEQLEQSLASLQTYWNPERHGFCAWKMFPGNTDIYYDDNAHAAQALISVYETTHNAKYLSQATSILQDLIIPASVGSDGRCNGVPWHISNPHNRHACSTGPAAVAALRLCAITPNTSLSLFASSALNWLLTNLQDPSDGLIWDHSTHHSDSPPTINKTKWSYNTGFAIHGFALLYAQTGHEPHLATATRLAHAALNRHGALFDHTVPNPASRMYSDGSFFLHHLADGYLALSSTSSSLHRPRLHAEIQHIANWGQTWMSDPADGLFFRGSRPYAIDEERTERFNRTFGTATQLARNREERDERGELGKTLIGNAGWVRVFSRLACLNA